ncbi:hypothetical protein DL771_005716 [Monosporascus sp. 5C6A]|nr:hypothetical protein DL771_005716 [Monosporascus sp. 5C6A]
MLAPGRNDLCHPLVSIAISTMLTFSAISKVTVAAVSDNARARHSMVFQWRSPIWAELLRRGWCQFELTPMSVRFNTAGLAFISRVERPIPSGNHERDIRRSAVTPVLDAWLFSTPSAGLTDAEKMMRIFSCTWNSRLRTYQQGALPEALYLQFEDVAEDLDQMKVRLENEMERDLGIRSTLGECLLVQNNSLRGLRDLDPRSEDFILLGTDVMLSIDVNKRIATFWCQVPCRPCSLLAGVPTLNESGPSWAPYTGLLAKERLSESRSLNTLPDISLRRPTILTARGLEIEGPGLLIPCDGFRPEGDFSFQGDHSFGYHLETMLYKAPSTGSVPRGRRGTGYRYGRHSVPHSEAGRGAVAEAGELRHV